MDSSPRDQFFYFIDCFIARSKNINTKTSKTQQNNNALESLLPSPHPKVGHPKRCFFLSGFDQGFDP